jgi:7-cyano-7-deazaguanine reductase
MVADTPLGKESTYPQTYSPDVLCAVPRAANRRLLGIGESLPFQGEDVWNAWELTWLDRRGKPIIATGVFRVPADSGNLIESKSLKLYLNSLAMSAFGSAEEVAAVIAGDLSRLAAGRVGVTLAQATASTPRVIFDLPGTCVDDADAQFDAPAVDPSLLCCTGEGFVTEALHSHLLRSNCPVTGQPDIGSVLIRYRGAAIDRAGLLRYLVSFRCHEDFHESCVERIFMDIRKHCAPEQLTVYARYNRRGGLDINPFRSDFEPAADNLRLWRQ